MLVRLASLPLLAAGVVFAAVGVEDLTSGPGAATRLTGVTVAVLGLALAASAALTALTRRSEQRASLELQGYYAGGLLGALLVVLQVEATGAADARLGLWSALLGASLLAIVSLRRRGARLRHFRRASTLLSATWLATFAPALAPFLPLAPLSLGEGEAGLTKMDVQISAVPREPRVVPGVGTVRAVEVTVSLSNTSRFRLETVGGWAVVGTGKSTLATPVPDDVLLGRVRDARWGSRIEESYQTTVSEVLIDEWSPGGWADPGGTYHREFVSYVPVDSADTVWVSVGVQALPADLFDVEDEVGEPELEPTHTGFTWRYRWPIRETSSLRRLVNDPRSLETRYEFDESSGRLRQPEMTTQIVDLARADDVGDLPRGSAVYAGREVTVSLWQKEKEAASSASSAAEGPAGQPATPSP